MAKATSRLVAYYLTLFGAVILTNVAIYFAVTRLLDLPATPSFRFLALCTALMLVVAALSAYRRIRTERSIDAQRAAGSSGPAALQTRLIAGIAGFVACSLLVVASIYLLSAGESIMGSAAAILAAVVAAIASRALRHSIRERGSGEKLDGPAGT